MILGNDVSHHNGKINWDKTESAGIKFSFIRAMFGYSEDKEFGQNWAEAKRAGIIRGAYGWPLHNMNQKELARRFVNRWIKDPGELPPVIDFESTKYHGNATFSELESFANEVERLSGERPIIYTSKGYWNGQPNHQNQLWALAYDLWVANYTSASQPSMPSVWLANNITWTFWQYTSKAAGDDYGASSGYMDLNRFNGELIDLLAYAGMGEIPDPEPSADYVEVTASSFLRFRPEPVYNPHIKTLIVERGEVLQIAGATIYEPASGITWLPVFTPSKYSGDFIGYISANSRYVKYL